MNSSTQTTVHKEAETPDAPQHKGIPKPTPRKAHARISTEDWLVPAGLIALSIVPAIGGGIRMAELTGGAEITPDNARFFASPLPVVLHIISVTLYSVLGAFQFSRGFRRWRPGWHRAIGRLLIPSGFVAALSGLWMSHFYPLPDSDGAILYVLRLLFGSAMVLSIVLGADALRRRNFARHGDWMIRGYAIGMGAGTQVLTLSFGALLLGTPDEFAMAVLMGAGWVINLVVAEWIIHRRTDRSKRTASIAFPRPL